MRIAILGAGFSGLAACINLSKMHQVDVYDPKGIGGDTSSIAAGLLHKYAGPRAKLNRFANEGERESLELFKQAELALGCSIILSKGILRVATTKQKETDYLARASQYPDCSWVEADQFGMPGLFIEDGLIVDCGKYLKGLWKACSNCRFIPEAVNSLKQLDSYDAIVAATGAGIMQFDELRSIKITQVKGQLLEFAWPDIPPLKVCLNAEAYIAMLSGNKSCAVGATYEKEFDSSLPDQKIAEKLLRPKIEAICPQLKYAEIIGCRSGVRASTPDHLPIIGRYSEKLFAITGMGSKGLLYHALYAKKLCTMINEAL